MVEQLTPKTVTDPKSNPETTTKRSTRDKATKLFFREDVLARLPLATKDELSRIVWDTKTTGLSVLLSQSTRTYRATFKLDGKQVTVKLGRVGEMKVEDARKRVVTYRGQANEGIDPRKPKPSVITFGHVVTEFIEQYCKTDMRAWDQVENLLTNSCEALWSKPIDRVTKLAIRDITDDIAQSFANPSQTQRPNSFGSPPVSAWPPVAYRFR
jgi:hypothetical protein